MRRPTPSARIIRRLRPLHAALRLYGPTAGRDYFYASHWRTVRSDDLWDMAHGRSRYRRRRHGRRA